MDMKARLPRSGEPKAPRKRGTEGNTSQPAAEDLRRGDLSITPSAVKKGALDDIAKEQLIADCGVGIDCHSRFIQVCVLANRDGTISRLETEYATTWEGLTEAREWALEAVTQMGEVRPDPGAFAYCIESTACFHLPVILCFDGLSGSSREPSGASAQWRRTLAT